MNVTLAMPDRLLEEARRVAEARGISLNQLIREQLEQVTATADRAANWRDLENLLKSKPGNSSGRRWKREDLYDRPVLR